VDAAPLVAQAEPDHPERLPAARVLATEPSAGILSPLTAAEVDYFLQRKLGPQGNYQFIEDLAAGRFEVPVLDPSDFATIATLNRQYRDLSPGLAGLSLVVLAARYRTTRLLTFDQRHFRLIRPLQGGAFTLLPFDADIA
jgi:predicted nucleic acid-binding protein